MGHCELAGLEDGGLSGFDLLGGYFFMGYLVMHVA